MEEFVIYTNGLKKMGAHLQEGCAHDCFRLVVAEASELKEHSSRIFGSEIKFSKEWERKERCSPFFEHIGPNLHFVLFNDLNHKGQEHKMRFFITKDAFVLMGWGEMKPELPAVWAERGLLNEPLDLALNLGYFVLGHHQAWLEQLEQEMDHVEIEILKGPRRWQQERIIHLHRKVLRLKKSLNSHLSVFSRLSEFQTSAGPALWKDLVADTQRELDEVRQMHDLVENLREAYQAAVDNRSNDIMKLLTLMASILLPINLLTSFFGMNFENMPLIHETYGLPVFYTLSFVIAALVFWYFWKQKWLK